MRGYSRRDEQRERQLVLSPSTPRTTITARPSTLYRNSTTPTRSSCLSPRPSTSIPSTNSVRTPFRPHSRPSLIQISTDQTHGVNLTVPITDAITQTFTAAPTFRSRHKAATKVALEALETAVEVMEAEYKRRLFNETDGYLSFNGVDPAREAATLNLPSFIQGMAKKYLLAKEPLSFTLTSTGTEPTGPGEYL
jgi:hypothetical protein